jgi:hypothetical protein
VPPPKRRDSSQPASDHLESGVAADALSPVGEHAGKRSAAAIALEAFARRIALRFETLDRPLD